jgi:transcriptional regulator with XRE-family HTH domain
MEVTGAAALANAVQRARGAAGLSQAQLADLAGVARVSVARLEAGTANATLDSLLRVATALGMRLDVTWSPQDATTRKLPRKRPRTTSTKTAKSTTTSSAKSKGRRAVGSKAVGGRFVTETSSRTSKVAGGKQAAATPVDLDVLLSQVRKK